MDKTDKHMSLVEQFYRELWNKFDKTKIQTLLTQNFKFRGSLGQYKTGHSEFSDYIEFIQQFSPDFFNKIEDMISGENKVFAKVKYTGTHQGKIFNIEPTYKEFSYYGAAIFSFENHYISEVWVLGDIYGLLQQLK